MRDLLSYMLSTTFDFLVSDYCSYILILIAISGSFSLFSLLIGKKRSR